jgi:hypothetical protein
MATGANAASPDGDAYRESGSAGSEAGRSVGRLYQERNTLMRLQYRQGDLLFVQQETRPSGRLISRKGHVIVAGEATGHAHRLVSGAILEAPDGALYLEVTQTTQVLHEEHAPITLDPGFWLVIRQREYAPEAKKTFSPEAKRSFRTVVD